MIDTLKVMYPFEFKVLGDTFGSDNNNVYYKSKIIRNADVNTFAVLSSFYSKDSKNVYFEDKIIENMAASRQEVRK